MVQNRNKLIDLVIGNISNSIIHKVLEKAINNEEISNRYDKEALTSWKIASKYEKRLIQ